MVVLLRTFLRPLLFFSFGRERGGTSISWMKRLGQSGLQAFRAVEGVGNGDSETVKP